MLQLEWTGKFRSLKHSAIFSNIYGDCDTYITLYLIYQRKTLNSSYFDCDSAYLIQCIGIYILIYNL